MILGLTCNRFIRIHRVSVYKSLAIESSCERGRIVVGKCDIDMN